MFGVMLILSIPCLFVLLRIARGFEDLKDHPGTWNLKCQASCALDHFFLPTHVLINHNDLHDYTFVIRCYLSFMIRSLC
jgi:hypothetical protein